MRKRLNEMQLQEALAEIPSLGGGIVVREDFYDSLSGLEGTQYNVTLAYAIGDLASLAVVTEGLSGVGLNATVSEVGMIRLVLRVSTLIVLSRTTLAFR